MKPEDWKVRMVARFAKMLGLDVTPHRVDGVFISKYQKVMIIKYIRTNRFYELADGQKLIDELFPREELER